MQPRDWTVCIIEPNKLDAQIMVDIVRNAGADRVKVFTDSAAALDAMELFSPNIIIAAYDSAPLAGVAWTKQFRRNHIAMDRTAPIFVTARALSKTVAEECRHAGANAVVIKPLSSQTLLMTIKKVLGAPREFIDAPGYTGPCRRIGIVTTDAPKRRRRSDAAKQGAEAAVNLKRAVEAYVAKTGELADCTKALNALQTGAAAASDRPMMGACAAFALLLSGKSEAPRDVLIGCMSGLLSLSDPKSEAAQRERIAERVHQAVAKVALQNAA
jgi:CheY-like chemotaxis protein